jgi:hypothetical protein
MLFSGSVRKVENGTTIVSSEQELQRQLTNALAFAAPWKIKTEDVIVDESKKIVVVNFSWVSEKIGPHITTVIIKFDKNNKIFELNEVYNTSQGILHPSLSSAAPSSTAPSSASSSSASSSSASSSSASSSSESSSSASSSLQFSAIDLESQLTIERDFTAKLQMEGTASASSSPQGAFVQLSSSALDSALEYVPKTFTPAAKEAARGPLLSAQNLNNPSASASSSIFAKPPC